MLRPAARNVHCSLLLKRGLSFAYWHGNSLLVLFTRLKAVTSRLAVLFSCLALAMPAGALRVSDVLEMDREALDQAGETTVTGLVTYAMSWLPGSLIVADPEDPDGPAVYLADSSRDPEVNAAMCALEEGDVAEFRATPSAFLLEPGWKVSRLNVLSRMSMQAPPCRSLAEMKEGRFNNRRARVYGVATSARIITANGSPLSLIELITESGPLAVRWHGILPGIDRLRDAELEIDGIVMPGFNPRGEFLFVELEAIGAEAVRVLKEAPSDPFDVRECLTPGVLVWGPHQRSLHTCKVRGEVTFSSQKEGYFVIQRGDSALRTFASGNWFPEVGLTVEAAGFPVVRGDSGVLESVVWRKTETTDPPVRPLRFLSSANDGPDLGWDAAASDVDYRLVEVEGRVTELDRSFGRHARIAVSTDGRSVDVVFPEPLSETELSRLSDRPKVVVRGVLLTHLTRSNAVGQYFAFDGFTILTRGDDDLKLVPDAAWVWRRLLRCGIWALVVLLPVLVLAVIALVVRRRSDLRRCEAVSADRKRIAGELHDTIAQHISGAKLWIYAAKTAAGENLPEPAADALGMAANVLEATRFEIRNAIMDLQGDEFLNDTPKAMLQRFARASDIPGRVRVRTSIHGLPEHLEVGEKRDLLAIVQEATSNATRHGEAKNVIIVSRGKGTSFVLAVLNDGKPFSAASAPGPDQGHFGLSNMRERARRVKVEIEFGAWRGYQGVRLERKAK